MSDLITVKNVSKTFAKARAVSNVSLTVKDGELLAIQGASGSGKTTLLNLLTGLEQADEGEILFDGENITSMNEDQLALFRRGHVGIVFQFFNLIPTLNVVENIALPLFPVRMARDDMLNRGKVSAEKVGLSHRLDHYPNELSGGEQQRVAIARALIVDPKVIFADEPTGNLDEKTGGMIFELLKNLNKNRDLTIVMATHDQSIAAASHRIIKLRDGMINNE
ncbi:MAG: ABC transporter ATP-binding protein [Candidatus Bathyarchaeia archaeon]|jgi:putative ABC transport system ATP-binding protein